MQTFLPFPSFRESAKVLDYRRLGKQRVEARQIIDTLENQKKAWANHPAVLMWADYIPALKAYFNEISAEWISRGYKHNMGFYDVPGMEHPWWFGDAEFHLAHQSNLVRKKPEFYGPIFPGVDGTLEYVWPVRISA